MYGVGGVALERPFKVRRLGHIGLNFVNLEANYRFYHDLMGFRTSDTLDWSERAPEKVAGLGNPLVYFTRYGSDHHSLLFGSRKIRDAVRPVPDPLMDFGEIAWQVDSLSEIQHASGWLKHQGRAVQRVGRDMPGSNWHVYFKDDEGQLHELYYGMEQVGWHGAAKPLPLYRDRFSEQPPLPQRSEGQEVEDSIKDGIDVFAGHRDPDVGDASYDVDGIVLQRPFRITRIGPIGLFVRDLPGAVAFYTGTLGFKVTEQAAIGEQQGVFLRANDEHHSLALYPLEVKQALGIEAKSTCAVLGFQVGNYRQLRNAVAYLKEHGVPVFDAPSGFSTGIDYAAHVLDPDGHVVRLYHAIERVGWDGQPKPAALRNVTKPHDWPETLLDTDGAFAHDIFQGPLG